MEPAVIEEQIEKKPAPPPLGPQILRGVLIATAALAAVFAFVRFDFKPPAEPNAAWAPTEVEGLKIAGPDSSAPDNAPRQPGQAAPTRHAKPVVTQTAIQPALALRSAEQHEIAKQESNNVPHIPAHVTPPSTEVANEDLDAPPPAPGVAASGRKPEDKPLHKRVFGAVGRFFKGKKPQPKVEQNAHNPHPEQ